MDVMVVGIDVSKDQLDVAVHPTGESLIFKRTGVGIEDLIARLGTLSPKMVAIAATGGFEAVVAAGLAGAGLPVVVVNPAQVRAFAQAVGKRAKTDLIDAAVIVHFAEATKPKLRQMPDEVTRLLADLVVRRRQIVEMVAAEGQRARRISDERLTRASPGYARRWRKNSLRPVAVGRTSSMCFATDADVMRYFHRSPSRCAGNPNAFWHNSAECYGACVDGQHARRVLPPR